MISNQKRNHGIDYLRAISCIAIIFIHTIYSGILMYGSELNFMSTVLYRAILNNLMWAVPCFIMITGALLLCPEKRISYSRLFSVYIMRLVKALVVFGLFFVVLEVIFNQEQRNIEHVLEGLYEIFNGKTWSHMWYLYCMIGLYLLLPFYKKIAAVSERKELLYLLVVYIIFLSLIPLLGIANVESGFYIHVSSIYPFWLFLGYYIKQYGRKISGCFYGLMSVGATILLILFTWIRWKWNLESLEQLFGYSSILVIIQATGIAGCFFKLRDCRPLFIRQFLLSTNTHSFGIYLIHMIYIRLVYKHLHFNPFQYGGIPGILLIVISSYILSYCTDCVLRKIPVFRSIL